MTTLAKHFEEIKKLMDCGYGDKEVIYRQGSSGDFGDVGSLYVALADEGVSDLTGLKEGEEYITLSIGS